MHRAIDILGGEALEAIAFKVLIRELIAISTSGKSKPAKKAES